MKHSTKKIQTSKLLLMIPLFAAGVVLYILGYYEETKRKTDPEIKIIDHMLVPGFLVHTKGCRIPYMNPYDPSIKKYLSISSYFNCSNKPPLIESNQTSIYVVPNALEAYNVTSELDLNCCYSPFWRKEVKSGTVDNGADNKIEYSSTCISFLKSANIYNEYVRVTCKVDDVEVYKDFHAFIVPKKINSNLNVTPVPQGPSVLIVGVDAVSRLNFYRQMPKTRKILNNLKAIEFVGYNKVADNTFPNLVPLFSGYSVEEIEKFCWVDSNSVFDDCPWIWKYYNTFGYNTGYGEDACWMGVFNYLKNGFSQPPVDYYLRTYMKIISARHETSTDAVRSNSADQYIDYIVDLITQPGDAKFEATVRHRSADNSMIVQGYISRINAYGSQSGYKQGETHLCIKFDFFCALRHAGQRQLNQPPYF